MPTDMRAIEEMLKDYSDRLSASIGGMIVRMEGAPAPASPEDEALREEEFDTLRRWIEYQEGVEAQWFALLQARCGDPIKLFAGTWPPTNPLDIEAMATTLLRDRDDPDLDGYIGEPEDWDEDEEPLMKAFFELHAAELALKPNSVEAATAIFRAASRDCELGCGFAWDTRLVNRARKLAVTELPRSR